MMHSRWVVVMIALAVVAVTSIPVGATVGANADTLQQDVPSDEIVMEANVHHDGSATWTVTHRIELENETRRDGFESLQNRIEANESLYLEPFVEDTRLVAAQIAERTNRSMVVENASITAEESGVPPNYGEVTYSVRWYGFAEPDDGLVVGDVLDGSFVGEGSRLVVSWPEDVEATSVSPAGDDERDRSVVWTGPIEFAQGEPRIALESNSGSLGPEPLPSGNDGMVLGLLVAVPIGLLVVGVVYRRRRKRGGDDEEDADADEDGGGEGGDGSDEEQVTSGDGGTSQELLSNEERVLDMLEARGGRMKQQLLVDELEWSPTKASEVVGALREDDRIQVFRLGRENVLALPGETSLDAEEGADANDADTANDRDSDDR